MNRDETGKLREKIARIICCFAKENKGCAECKEASLSPFPNCFDDIKDETAQILQVCEAEIEKARKRGT